MNQAHQPKPTNTTLGGGGVGPTTTTPGGD